MLDRRQMLTGAAFAGVVTSLPGEAWACSREPANPFSARFWQKTWSVNVTWPAQARATIEKLVQGILTNTASEIATTLEENAHLFMPPSPGATNRAGTGLPRAQAIRKLANFTAFERDHDHRMRITTLYQGQYLVVAELKGSGFRKAPANPYGLCGEDIRRYRTQMLCARVTTNFGGSGLISQIVWLY